jgi:hypothetical protein
MATIQIGSTPRMSAAIDAARRAVARLRAAWNSFVADRAARRLDAYFSHGFREQHERFLSRARDPYELERLEREWSFREADTWRML